MKLGDQHSEIDIEKVKFFIGKNAEKTPSFGKNTLFVIGEPDIEEIARVIAQHKGTEEITHIHFGAERSFVISTYQNMEDDWLPVIVHFLTLDYWCTLEVDSSVTNIIHESKLTTYTRFIPLISVKIPFVNELGYNGVLKIDDVQYNHSNVGVWCHMTHDLLDRFNYTGWDDYNDDYVLTPETLQTEDKTIN